MEEEPPEGYPRPEVRKWKIIHSNREQNETKTGATPNVYEKNGRIRPPAPVVEARRDANTRLKKKSFSTLIKKLTFLDSKKAIFCVLRTSATIWLRKLLPALAHQLFKELLFPKVFSGMNVSTSSTQQQ